MKTNRHQIGKLCGRSWGMGIALPAMVIAFGASPAAAEESSTALTIYSTSQPGAIPPELYRSGMQDPGYRPNYARMIPGYAVVKQERSFTLEQDRSTVRFSDVAALIDPTTVTFTSLTDPAGTHVLEQNYEFDLVSAEKLMLRYLDREITVEQVAGDSIETTTGTLLGTTGGLILRRGDGGIQVINGYSNVRFPELPGGLITKPTLVWDLFTNKPGPHDTRVSYQTSGITWWADYNIIFTEGKNANAGVLDVGAWVSIINQSGATYPEAKLKLMAGDVHRAPQPQPEYRIRLMSMEAGARAAPPGFEEKAFFEYHLYTLGRPTTLPDNSTKQIELFPGAHGVNCEKVLVYYGQASRFGGYYGEPLADRNLGTQSNKKVDIYLKFKNDQESGLGIPLPSGRIRVSQMDPADQSLEFIGEDVIDHTPKDETVLIKMGSAFDVVGERTQTDFSTDSRRRIIDEDIEIKIRNHKEEPINVLVKESLYRWSNWKITKSSHDYEKVNSRTIHFPIRVGPDEEVTVTYHVHYSW